MTITEAKRLLNEVEEARGHGLREEARALERVLHLEVLRTIAYDNPPDSHLLAAIAARSK